MTPTTYLIQCASGKDVELLRLGYPIHADYCARHSLQYFASFERNESRNPVWNFIPILRDLLTRLEEGALVVKLDADALIVGDEDIRSALPDGYDFGMVERSYQSGSILNAGVFFVRNSEAMRKFWSDVWSYDGEENENLRMVELLQDGRSGLKVARLDGRWNFCGAASPPTYPVQIRAWHGESREAKLSGMKAASAALGYLEETDEDIYSEVIV